MLSYKKSLQLKNMGYPQPQAFSVGQWWWDDSDTIFAPQMFRVSAIDDGIGYVGINSGGGGAQYRSCHEAVDVIYSPSIESLMSELGDGYGLSVVPAETDTPQRWGVWPMGAKCIEGDPCIADSIEDALADMWIQKTGRRVVILPEMPTTLDEFEDFMYVLVRALDKNYKDVAVSKRVHVDIAIRISFVKPEMAYGGWTFVFYHVQGDEGNWFGFVNQPYASDIILKPKT